MIAFAAVSGAMAVAGPVHADSTANGAASDSPGLISGNGIQLPVHVPVNVCGNTLNVVGLLNPAMGNGCANEGGGTAGKERPASHAEAAAHGVAHNSPGVVSGNDIQLPVDLPVNVSGNSVNVVGIGNPAFGNKSVNGPADRPDEPQRSTPPRHEPPVRSEPPSRPHGTPPVRSTPRPAPVVRERASGTLAHTGTDSTWGLAAASLASLMGGTVLYRRSRSKVSSREG
ncbi:chaplin [Streptomyces dangxiongensis]|uniref:Chaplin n=1 Tax=Streptomyces dangxiongensis TaxID=1442032 RepID=A0A3G2JC73_9ACTN|nr:chaplin [Streptomyces dangxiongensis]AYN38132.1 chaplin [Streptomyces dangxiongensis]